MRLLFVTGSRGEWGYIRPILKLIQQREGVDYAICATNMHLLPSHGLPLQEIEADGFRVEDRIPMALDGDDHFVMVKSLGVFAQSFVDVVLRQQPDWIILAGDRGEQLTAAMVGAYTYTPVAHIQAGERSGNIDGVARHALAKLVHLHFAANGDAAERLIRAGEEPFRVHTVGAPQLDELFAGAVMGPEALFVKYHIDVQAPYLLIVQHPVTEEYAETDTYITKTLDALDQFDEPKVWILPNNDAGAQIIRRAIMRRKHGEMHPFANVPRQDYLGFVRHAAAMVGNSSSAIIEAPVYRTPAVNIGRRQNQRVRGENVIDCSHDVGAIAAAIRRAISPEFRASLTSCTSPYGDGRSSERILNTLVETPRDERLLRKQMTY